MSKLSSAQQSGLFQYLSLILIILAVLIAASRPKANSIKPEQIEKVLPRMAHSEFLSEINLNDVFINNTLEIDTKGLEPLKEILLNHNLDLNLKIESNENSAAKAIKLTKVLREQGFWKDSFTVIAFENLALVKTSLVVKFEWSEL